MQYSPGDLDWQIYSPTTNSKGGRSAAVLRKSGKPIEITLADPTTEPLRSPFGASVYGESEETTRLNLDLNLNNDIEKWLRSADDYIVKQASRSSTTLFKKELSEEEVRKTYVPLVREKEGWAPKVRTKVNLNKVRVWSTERARREVPERLFKDCNLWPKVVVKSLWLMGTGAWGLSLECIDIMIAEDQPECPW